MKRNGQEFALDIELILAVWPEPPSKVKGSKFLSAAVFLNYLVGNVLFSAKMSILNLCIICLLLHISSAVLKEIILRFPEKFDIDKDELADGRLIWFLAEGDWRRLPTR